MSFNTANYATDRIADAWSPASNPRLFEGVRSRRMLAFVIDVMVIAAPIVAATLFVLVLSILTLGLGLVLLWPLHVAAVLWAVLYYGMTIGGSASATIGMRLTGLQIRTWQGDRASFLLGAVHAIVFWTSVTVLTPLVLLVSLINPRKQLLHDMLLGAIVVRNPAHAADLARPY
jgi:uncharacterized RDD family membrane protein YckC